MKKMIKGLVLSGVVLVASFGLIACSEERECDGCGEVKECEELEIGDESGWFCEKCYAAMEALSSLIP